MGCTLNEIVPWGRSNDEYVRMFNLTTADLQRRILGCGDGPAGFNAELNRHGGTAVSIDPIYRFNADQIRRRISETYAVVMSQVEKNKSDYVWNNAIASVEKLGELRMAAMQDFLADFENGKSQGRYIAAELPALPFESDLFDIALSSHFLFLYSTHLSAEFHLHAIQEMLRVAREARIFPLIMLDGKPSPYLAFVLNHFIRNEYDVEICRVEYEFQRGGNEMLKIKAGKQ
ncbi:MAG: SAM-dependent methyltransferase [Methylococcaceae bacterium]|nr:SAM-dependent methyltransferase [Methylococcaceae bacterium]